MNSLDSKINILIVGATGALGSLVTKHCLANPNLNVSILVRDPQKNKDLTSQVEQAGGKVIQGDVAKPETIKGVTKGIHTIIFTLSYEEKITVDGQIAVINDGLANGVQRVVPTEFTENFTKFPKEEVDLLLPVVYKRKVKEYLKTVPIKALYINTGVFVDAFFANFMAKEFGYWGDPNHKFQLTSYDDTARFVAAVVAKKDRVGDAVFVANEVSVNEAAEIYNRVRGTNFVPKNKGSLEDAKAQAAELEKKGDPSAWFARFYSFWFDDRSRFDTIHNAEFPEIKGVTVEEFLKQRPDISV